MDYLELISEMARIYYYQADWHKALLLFRRELELNPNSCCIYHMANVYETIGDYTNAELYQTKIAERSGDQKTLADFYYRHQKYDKALPIYVDFTKEKISCQDDSLEHAPLYKLRFQYEKINEDYSKILRCYDELGIHNDPFKEEIRNKLEEHTRIYRKRTIEQMSQSNPIIKQIVDEDGFLDDKPL